MNILKVENLFVYKEKKKILESINFSLKLGEVLGIIGESGGGKTTLVSCILKNLNEKWSIDGQIKIRFENIALIPQDYSNSLNPLMKIKSHFYELMSKLNPIEKKEKTLELLSLVKIDNPHDVLELYPHQLSGGMLQRINIALALLVDAELIIADEFTSNLDSDTQKKILRIFKELIIERNKTVILISHDLKIIKELADTVCVINKGKIVEYNKKERLLSSPENDYTKYLIQNSKFFNSFKKEVYSTEEIIKIDGIYKRYNNKEILNNISFTVYKNQSIGIMGSSGSGKTTLARIITGIEIPDSGDVFFYGAPITKRLISKNGDRFHIIFQNSKDALNPYRKIKNILFDVNTNLYEIENILKEVDLTSDILYKYPRQLSGGQAQRVCIARGLLSYAELLVLDEPTSNLDKITEKQILNLLKKIKMKRNITYLLISHDLDVIENFCDRVLFLNQGKINEKTL